MVTDMGTATDTDRKSRLRALRERAEKKGDAEAATNAIHEAANEKDSSPTLKFRNYAVKDDRIKHKIVEQARAKTEDAPVVDVEKALGVEVSEVIANVAPKKPNWDLRREIAGRLARLERRTQRAIAELAVEEEKKRMAAA